jgi:uncharacterized protein YdaU (DUF1376 family)
MSNTYHRTQPISNHFYSLGTDGIGLHRIEERRASDREQAATSNTGTRAGAIPALRRTIGSWLIAAGERALAEPAVVPAS